LQKSGEIQLVAASDIYEKAKERARERIGLEARAVHHDYRDLLSRKDVDAVVIVVPEHLHHRMAMDALRAGKDVYLEKPMTFTIAEAKELEAVVRQTKRVLPVGSQHVSDPRFHAAKDIIERGLIGPVMGVQASWSASMMYGLWQYKIEPEATAKTVDWKAFLGPAPQRPFSGERYFRWRKYWDYSGGIPTDLFYHELSPLLYAVGSRFPVRVSAHGGIRVFKDREVPDVFSMIAEYQDFSIEFSGMSTAGALGRNRPMAIFGREASITFAKGGVQVTPERLFKKKFEAAAGTPSLTIEPKLSDYEEIRMVHMRDFLSSMRTRRQPVSDVGLGYRVMTAIKLGVDSYRQNRMMFFDPEREAVVDRAPQRPGYEGDGANYDEPGLALPDGRLS
jgi:predicted dehydrogenase